MDKPLTNMGSTEEQKGIWKHRYQNLIDSVHKWPTDIGNHFTELAKVHNVLNESYSDIVASSIEALVVYEDYLLNKTDSQELAKAMTNLKASLPPRNNSEKKHAKFARKLRRRNKAPRIGSKRHSRRKKGKPPTKIDGP